MEQVPKRTQKYGLVQPDDEPNISVSETQGQDALSLAQSSPNLEVTILFVAVKTWQI